MKNYILIVSLFCILSACKREYDPNKFGPEVIITSPSFTVSGFTVSPSTTVNLASQTPYFNCTMSERVEFKFIITGLLSGAEKTISGIGEYIDITNSSWAGDSDNLNIFRMGENCSVELSFHGAIKKYYDTITISGENVYPNTTLVNSFEGIIFDKNGPNTGSYGVYFDAPDMQTTNIFSDNTLKTCQGIQSAGFDGVDVNGSYYIGGMYFFPSGPTYIFNGYRSDSLYLNAYVYSYGDNSAKLVFAFSEDDNSDGVIDLVNDDVWTQEVLVEGQGWNLQSLRFDKFKDGNPTVGNGVLNPDKIKGFNVNFSAKAPGTRARANVDYILVSYGKPFAP
jgi:hypothetical protein